MSKTLERIKQYIDFKKISIRAFEIACGFSNGAFASQLKNKKTIGVDKLENILNIYSEINANWLLTGKGNMLLNIEENQPLKFAEPNENYKTENADNRILQLLQNQIAELKEDKEELKKDKHLLQEIIHTKLGNQKAS